MSKYNRKQKAPKEDEFVSFWAKAFKTLEPYFRAIGISLASACAVTFAVWGLTSWREHKAQNAAELFGRAVKIYDADLLVGDAPKTEETEENPIPRYKTEKERVDATMEQLDKLDKEFGSSPVAKNALVFRAGVLYDQGKYDDAAKLYEKFLKEGSSDAAVTALGREGLGLCHEARNKLDDALAAYQAIEPTLKSAKSDFYLDRALYDQARVYLKKGDKKKAADLYKEALAKVPATPLKDEIQTQLASLEGT
jgi:tetratricopeptide (TPR) repeat protein